MDYILCVIYCLAPGTQMFRTLSEVILKIIIIIIIRYYIRDTQAARLKTTRGQDPCLFRPTVVFLTFGIELWTY